MMGTLVVKALIMDKYGISKRHYEHWKGMEIMEYVKKGLVSRSLVGATHLIVKPLHSKYQVENITGQTLMFIDIPII